MMLKNFLCCSQGSKSNELKIRGLDQNQVLKRWEWGSLARILTLACFSLKSLKGITQEWRERSERALSKLGKVFSSSNGKEREGWRGMEGYLYLSTWKLAVGSGLPGDSGYKPGNSGLACFLTLNRASGDSGQQGPEYLVLYPEYPGLAG